MEQPKKVSRGSKETDAKETYISLWSLVKDFCDYTSAHGFGRIKAATHWTLTLFWSLLFIGAVTIMTAQVHTLFKKYQDRPLTTLVEVKTSTVRMESPVHCSLFLLYILAVVTVQNEPVVFDFLNCHLGA